MVRLCTLIAAAVLLSTPGLAQSSAPRYINPPGLVKPNGYTHVVVSGDGRTVYIAGQVAFDSTGAVVGGTDFRAQAEQVYGNLRRALASVGASFSDVVKTTTLITDLKQLGTLREVRSKYFGAADPPANTLIPVASLARPELLLEVEAVAVLPAASRR
jgi:enamine deaminase RidA (YjgF/YER057c/UK114 family)